MRPEVRGAIAVVGWAVLAVPLVVILAQFELKAVYAVLALTVVVVGGFLLRADVVRLVQSKRSGLAAARARSAQTARRPATPIRPAARAGQIVGLIFVAGAGAGVAWIAALLGTKGLVAAIGAVGLISLLMFIKDKSIFFTFATVCSLTLLLHKSFGYQDLSHGGGAISVYITSFDVLLVLLYGLWIWEGTFLADVRAAFRRPLIWLPLFALLFLLPSLLAADDIRIAVAELVRMAWMYALYAYVGIRVRTIRHVWSILIGLITFALAELVVVLMQWRTGGILGLGFLGIPESLIPRTTDTGEIGRPSGTILHPAFMAAALGIVAAVCLALAIELSSRLLKVATGVTALGCLACMWISQTRASFVAVVLVGGIIIVIGLVRRRITWRAIGVFALIAGVATAALWSKISAKLADNFGTGHYSTEVASRLELNDVALRMINDHPLIGVGLNNFETALPRYEANPVIFPGYPVHNLYLLWLGEVGIFGFIGVLILGIGLYDAAIRLGRSQHRLFAAVGIGTAGAMAFMMIEELLGYTLRGDIPLAQYFLLAGLVAACTTMSGRTWPALRKTTAKAPNPRRVVRIAAVASSITLLITLAPLAPRVLNLGPNAAAAPVPGLLVSGNDRSNGLDTLYAANADGTGLHQISPKDGQYYNWARFAFGNTKIVYTVRKAAGTRTPESIGLMNLDGSGAHIIRHFSYHVAQPLVDRTGRYLHYTAVSPSFPIVGQFRLDLATGQSLNLTAVTSPGGGFDADPFLTNAGDSLLFVENNPGQGTGISQMDTDGTNRRHLTSTRWFNTDPAISRDGKTVAISSYRGDGLPRQTDPTLVSRSSQPEYWYITIQPRYERREKVLAGGLNCTTRLPSQSCTPKETSGFVPRFMPDQGSISYVATLNYQTTCVCAVGIDGENARVVIASTEFAINWYDWPQPSGYSTDTELVDHVPTDTNLLVTLSHADGTHTLERASSDLANHEPIVLPAGLDPVDARWGPDGKTIVFTALVKPGPAVGPHPAAPPGRQRRTHITLDDISPLAAHERALAAPRNRNQIARQQVFLRKPDGQVRQLTDPWIEDWRDGLPDGDRRGNSQPRMSADGRFVVFTNHSTTTGESFLLRLDLTTDEVLNLTNGTAGAMPTDDADAAYAPDSNRLAFSWTKGSLRGVYLMDGAGERVDALIEEPTDTSSPGWAPNGKFLVYSRATAKGSKVVRADLVAGGTRTANHRTISQGLPFAYAPLVSGDGKSIGFLAPYGSVVALWVSDAAGSGPPRPLVADVFSSIESVDWK